MDIENEIMGDLKMYAHVEYFPMTSNSFGGKYKRVCLDTMRDISLDRAKIEMKRSLDFNSDIRKHYFVQWVFVPHKIPMT